MAQRCGWIPVVQRFANVAGSRRAFAFEPQHQEIALFTSVLNDTIEHAKSRNKTMLALSQHGHVLGNRSSGYALQWDVIQENPAEPTGKIGAKTPVEVSSSLDKLIPEIGLPCPKVYVLLVPSMHRFKCPLVPLEPVDFPLLKDLNECLRRRRIDRGGDAFVKLTRNLQRLAGRAEEGYCLAMTLCYR